MTSSRKKRPARKTPVALYVVGAVAVLGLIAFLTTGLGSDGATTDNGARQFADVSVTGGALPATVDEGADPAVGMALPELRGQSFDGTPVAITNDGRPKAIILLAHW